MQALSKSNNTILLNFDQIKNPTLNINSLLKIWTDLLNDQRKKEMEEFQKIIDDKEFVE